MSVSQLQTISINNIDNTLYREFSVVDINTNESIIFDEAHIKDRIIGCLLGTAAGDSLGLPREGLTRQRAYRIFGSAPLNHRFIFNRGMVSDDTENIIMVAQALLDSKSDISKFTQSLAWKMRWWLLSIPAGIGLATIRGITKLWLGWSSDNSGVYSAGNGPAMRAPIIGAYAYKDVEHISRLIRVSTRITHTDPRAEQGAMIIALAARYGMMHGPVVDAGEFLASIHPYVKDDQLLSYIDIVEEHIIRNSSIDELLEALGITDGVSGFINHTVPVVIFCWLRYGNDFKQAMEKIILSGGDTDTTGAILGGIMGATYGESCICREWITGISEWPRSTSWIRLLGKRLAYSIFNGELHSPSAFYPGIILRNIVFLVIVLYHGFRRLFPPY